MRKSATQQPLSKLNKKSNKEYEKIGNTAAVIPALTVAYIAVVGLALCNGLNCCCLIKLDSRIKIYPLTRFTTVGRFTAAARLPPINGGYNSPPD